jgi:hypothetical protein
MDRRRERQIFFVKTETDTTAVANHPISGDCDANAVVVAWIDAERQIFFVDGDTNATATD